MPRDERATWPELDREEARRLYEWRLVRTRALAGAIERELVRVMAAELGACLQDGVGAAQIVGSCFLSAPVSGRLHGLCDAGHKSPLLGSGIAK
jgi:hypothetical protein